MDERGKNQEKEFEEILPDDFEESQGISYRTDQKRMRPSAEGRNHLFLAAAVAVLLVAVLLFVTAGGNDDTNRSLNVLEDRIRQMEEKLAYVESTAPRIAKLETRQKVGLADTEATRQRQRRLQEKVEALNKRLEAVEKGLASLSVAAKETAEEKTPHATRAKAGYHQVRPGDTLYGIANEYGLGVKELCRLNDISPDATIRPGEKILVVPLER
jgi:LysM repeat protein